MSKPNFVEQGMNVVKQAIGCENKRDYASAEQLYTVAINYFDTAFKYEKNENDKQRISKYIETYNGKKNEVHALAGESVANDASKPTSNAARGGKGQDKAKEDAPATAVDDEFEKLIMKSNPGVTFDSIAGLVDCKQAINEALVYPTKFPQLFQQNGIKPWGGMLLFGPPGTGKTQLGRAVATEIKSSFFAVSATTILDKWVGQSEKNVVRLFDAANRNAPSIIFIDEVEALMSERSSRSESSDVNDRVLTVFLQCIDGITSKHGGVFLMAATNFPEKIDTAMLRRFEKRIYVPLPDAHARAHIFKIEMKSVNTTLSDQDYTALGDRTPGYSGADIATVVKDVKMSFMRKYQTATHLRINATSGKYIPCDETCDGAVKCDFGLLSDDTIENLPVTLADMFDSLGRHKPSTTEAGNQKYLQFMDKF